MAEGEWDFFCLWERGFKNVVTSTTGVGTFPDDKIYLLKGKNVVLAYDKGVDARCYEGMYEKLKGIANSVRVIDWQGTKLKDEEDVRDYFKKYNGSRRGFLKLIKNARTLIELEIEKIDHSLEGLELNRKLKPIFSELSKLTPSEIDAYLNIIKDRFELSGEDIKGFKREITSIIKESKGEQEQINEPVPTAMFPKLVDIVEHEGNPAFLILESDGLKIKFKYELDGVVYEPPSKENLIWLLPRAEEVLKHYKEDNEQKLYCDLVTYHKSISELPLENYYQLLTLWDFHTYLFDRFDYSPYIWLYSVSVRGKTRTGKGCIYVAWRGLDIESLREATLLRYAQDLKSTLFFDVMDIWAKAERSGSADILLKRFEKGATVSRVQHPEKGPHKDMRHYEIYGPTMIATNEQVDDILATRAIQIIMPYTSEQFEVDMKPEMGLPYKERLTAFRAKFMCKPLPEAKKPVSGRIGDILRPLRQIVKLVCPQEEDKFLEMVKEIELERRKNLRETLEARIVEALFKLKNEFKRGMLKVDFLKQILEKGVPERFQRTQSFYTRKIKSLGLKTERPGGNTHIVWNEDVCNKLAQRYIKINAQSALSALNEQEAVSKRGKKSKRRVRKTARQ